MKQTTSKQLSGGAIAQQAATYVAQAHSGKMTEAEELSFQRWFGESPQHEAEYRKALAAWDKLEGLADDPELLDLDAMSAEYAPDRATERGKSGHSVLRWALAACLVVAAGLTLLQVRDFFSQPGSDTTIYMTRVGEQKSVPLPDGSVVALNTDSQVQVTYSGDRRKVVLERGEVFFDITSDATRPFVVRLGSQSITVLGTRFNVYKKGAEITVAVEDGVIALHPENTPVRDFSGADNKRDEKIRQVADQYRLAAGSVITFKDRSEIIATSTLDGSNNYYPWQEGVVTFIDKPLVKVVEEMNRYTNRKVLISDADIMDMKVSGVLHVREVEQALFGLKAAFPLEVTFNVQSVVLARRESEQAKADM